MKNTTSKKKKPARMPKPLAPAFEPQKATVLVASHSVTFTSSAPLPPDFADVLENFLPAVAVATETNIELINAL